MCIKSRRIREGVGGMSTWRKYKWFSLFLFIPDSHIWLKNLEQIFSTYTTKPILMNYVTGVAENFQKPILNLLTKEWNNSNLSIAFFIADN